jgi:hypothetical protein
LTKGSLSAILNAQIIDWNREKNSAIVADLDEHLRRQLGAAEARWGGVAAVTAATGMSDRTIRSRIKKLDDSDAAVTSGQRRPGEG